MKAVRTEGLGRGVGIHDHWVSSFPDKNGLTQKITDNTIVTVASSEAIFTGGHSKLFIEFLEHGSPQVFESDLTYTKVFDTKGRVIQKPINVNFRNLDDNEISDLYSKVSKNLRLFKSYSINSVKKDRLIFEIGRFRDKSQFDNRYKYSEAGGAIGRFSSMHGRRGLNCADFIEKVLEDAGVCRPSKISLALYNSPARIAGHRTLRIPSRFRPW